MTEPANGARGEVALKIGNVDLVIAATMGGLSAVSTRLECKSFQDLFLRLSQVEPSAVLAAIELMTVRGDVAKAMKTLKLKHFNDVSTAINVALSHHFEDDESGNEKAVAEVPN